MAARVPAELVSQDLAGNALSTVTCTVTLRDTATNATLYTASTGGTTKPNPFTVTNGVVNFWIVPGSYDVTITGAGITPVIKHVEAISASDNAITTLTVTGTFSHTGTLLGFYGATPIVRSSGWSVTNVTTDKVYNANSLTLDELADVLGSLITYLKDLGLLA